MDLRQLRRREHGRRGPLPQLRHLANGDPTPESERPALTRSPAAAGRAPGTVRPLPITATLAIGASLVIALLAAAPAALGDDSSPAPATSAPQTCAERFPGVGPAGVDLQLGCLVSVVVGAYVPGQPADPPPLSSYAMSVGVLVVGLAVIAWFVGRLLARRAGRRLAPVLPGAWWVCATCRSVNGAGVAHCYSCGAGRPDGPVLTTDAKPGTPQSFGARRKSG